MYGRVQNQVFYLTGIFGNLFFGGAGGGFCVFKTGIPGSGGLFKTINKQSTPVLDGYHYRSIKV